MECQQFKSLTDFVFETLHDPAQLLQRNAADRLFVGQERVVTYDHTVSDKE